MLRLDHDAEINHIEVDVGIRTAGMSAFALHSRMFRYRLLGADLDDFIALDHFKGLRLFRRTRNTL